MSRTRIRWTPGAVSDLRSIKDFISRDSPRYGKLVVDQLVQATDILADHQEAGRVVPELRRPEIRELIRGSYRIVYRVKGNAAEILTVFRASRLLPLDIAERQ